MLIGGNLPRDILVYTLNYASFLIPYFNLMFFVMAAPLPILLQSPYYLSIT